MIVLIWIFSGIVGVWIGTPPWMRRHDPTGFAIMHVWAAIGGPGLLVMGIYLLVTGSGMTERDGS